LPGNRSRRQGKRAAGPLRGKGPRDGLGHPQQRQHRNTKHERHKAQELGEHGQPKQHDGDAVQYFLLVFECAAVHSILRWGGMIAEQRQMSRK
jgi:hypothetical protein